MDQVKQNDKIKILTNSEVIGVKGRQGKFMITLATGSGEQQEEYGAVIIAAGTVEYTPTSYLYGNDARVVNGTKALNSIKTGTFMAEKGGVYAFIQCVGSRCTDHHYCSRTCCLQSVESAIIIQTMDPEAQVYVFYRDIRTPGYLEKRYLEARNAGVIFVQYDAAEPPELDKTDGSLLTLTAIDPMSGRSLLIHPDQVILAVAQAPSNSRELAKLFHVQVNLDGFLMETHHNFGSIAFPNGGIYIAGTAQGPKSMAECLSQSRGIAVRAAKMLKQPFVKLGGCVAEVDSSKCAACLTCVRVCPFGVPVIDRMEKAMGSAHISAAECRGCGVCAAECPNKAIELGHYEVDQLRESIHIALTEAVYER
jgi:heterodisulfide reductase subunit A